VKIKVDRTSEELGQAAAEYSAEILNAAIAENGEARLLLSTGASQLDTLTSLVKMDVNWDKVTLFHLDEYIDLPENHPASFHKYLYERFIDIVGLKNFHLVKANGDIGKNIEELTKEIRKSPIDLGLIGIGENAHIAFNDPPADFDTKDAYFVVTLEEKCKRQQVREGWFASIEDVPKQAITITAHQIMQCKVIVSSVPYLVKAEAVKNTLQSELTNQIPATLLKNHPNFTMFLDADSASLVDEQLITRYK
jgi:glucosamine-6-phosphate deaminase